MDLGFVSSWISGWQRATGKRPGVERTRRRCAVDCRSVSFYLRQRSFRTRLGSGEGARRRLFLNPDHGFLAQDTERPGDGVTTGVSGDGQGPRIPERMGEEPGVAAAFGAGRRSRKYRRLDS